MNIRDFHEVQNILMDVNGFWGIFRDFVLLWGVLRDCEGVLGSLGDFKEFKEILRNLKESKWISTDFMVLFIFFIIILRDFDRI